MSVSVIVKKNEKRLTSKLALEFGDKILNTTETLHQHSNRGNWNQKYIIKMESNDELEEIDVKNRMCY